MKTYTEFSYLVYMQSMIGICCDLLNELKNSYVRMIFHLVCHGKNDMHWGDSIMKDSYGGIYCLYDVTWNGLCGSHDHCDYDICGDGTATLICCNCTCPGDSV